MVGLRRLRLRLGLGLRLGLRLRLDGTEGRMVRGMELRCKSFLGGRALGLWKASCGHLHGAAAGTRTRSCWRDWMGRIDEVFLLFRIGRHLRLENLFVLLPLSTETISFLYT